MMSFFLVEYDQLTGRVRVDSFENESDALRQLGDREAAKKDGTEVVLLFGKSMDDVRITHSRYFANEHGLLEDAARDLDDARR
jgi:hypothetical protein